MICTIDTPHIFLTIILSALLNLARSSDFRENLVRFPISMRVARIRHSHGVSDLAFTFHGLMSIAKYILFHSVSVAYSFECMHLFECTESDS